MGWSSIYTVTWKTQDSKPDVCQHLGFFFKIYTCLVALSITLVASKGN